MDFVVVTHAPDIKLLRHFLDSYEVYYQSKGRIFIFASIDDRDLLEQIRIPNNASVLYREDVEGLTQATPFSQQLFLKLIAHRVVTTEYFCIMDSDFLFISPTHDADFFHDGKPVWFYRAWVPGEPPLRWRAGSEAYVGSAIPVNFACVAQYIFKRSIAADHTSRYDPKNILNSDGVSEFLVYAWFAHRYYPDEYLFAKEMGPIHPIVRVVNQIPPSYCDLDSRVSYYEFKSSNCVAFWSHWELAEAKMIEFFEDSQRENFGELRRHADGRPLYKAVVPGLDGQVNLAEIEGLYSDCWVRDTIRFAFDAPSAASRLHFAHDVPGNQRDPEWRLAIRVAYVGLGEETTRELEPGSHDVVLPVPETARGRRCFVEVKFGPGFTDPGNPDGREFRARLQMIKIEQLAYSATPDGR